MARFGTGKGRRDGPSGARQGGADLVQLVIAYVKQETLDPLKGVGRFLAFGIAGSLAIAAGVVLLLVAVLRLLQTETTAFQGNLSWIPYLIVVALAGLVIALSAWRITSGPARRRLPESKGEQQ